MSKQSQGNAKRSLVAVLLALTASTHCLASMQEMGDEEIQGVVGQDGLSIVLSNNFGYRWKDIPAVDGVAPAKANGFRFVAPRRPMYDANQMTEFDNEYLEISDYSLSTSDYAPITDPMKLDLVTLPDGKAAIQFSLAENVNGLGKKSIGFTLGSYARIQQDNNTAPSSWLAPEKWTIGRIEMTDIVQRGTKYMLTPMNDGFGFSFQTEFNIASLSLYPQFTRDSATGLYALTDDEWFRATNVAVCGALSASDTCVPGSKFVLGDPVAGPMVLKAESVDGSPAITLTMGNVNVQARDGDTPLAQGSIVIDSLKAQTAAAQRCVGGTCDFGKQIIGDMKIYSMRVRFTDLNR
ncbi:MAG: hypothetical protein RL210_2479 [Pseudomonadota bacterium]|jgi:hypothetical protein|nr:hypothetical protein [Pseudomonadota bacterium]